MAKMMNISGKVREIKLIKVNKEKGTVTIYFADETFIKVDGIQVEIETE